MALGNSNPSKFSGEIIYEKKNFQVGGASLKCYAKYESLYTVPG